MRLATVASGLIATHLAACTHNDPPAPDGSPSIAQAEMPAETRAAPTATSIPTPMPTSTPVPTPSADLASLPQTRDMPHASGPAFEKRVAGLWDAIITDEPARAEPFFFPVGAYNQVKDIPSPGADWKHRLMSAYARDIHALHARLTDEASRAIFVALEVPDARVRWVDPGEEYNKIGYFRVFGSKLRYEIEGERRSFDVKSLISWRGEWYVVHLSAIK
jgi:hypothetical protein